jgi:hypothetical protein
MGARAARPLSWCSRSPWRALARAVDPPGTAPERIGPAEPLPELDAVSVGVADFRPFGTSEIILLLTEGTYCDRPSPLFGPRLGLW